MTKWEHRWSYVDLGKLEDAQKDLDKLGEQGWQATGLVPNPANPNHAVVLMTRVKSS